MYAKTGYEETISLVSLLAAPGSSLSELISDSVSCLNWSFFIAKITSSFLGGTCSFVSLSFYFDGKKRVRFSGILSEVLFHWWLLVIINDHSKTNFYLSSSLKKWYFTLKCLDIQSKLFNKVISVVPRTLNSIILILVLLISVTIWDFIWFKVAWSSFWYYIVSCFSDTRLIGGGGFCISKTFWWTLI